MAEKSTAPKRPRGRPARAGVTASEIVKLRVTQDEKDALLDIAAVQGVSTSEVVRAWIERTWLELARSGAFAASTKKDT